MYGRYVMDNILRTTKRPYLDKFPAPEALNCCVQICLLQRIAPRTPLDEAPLGPSGPPGPLVGPQWTLTGQVGYV